MNSLLFYKMWTYWKHILLKFEKFITVYLNSIKGIILMKRTLVWLRNDLRVHDKFAFV